MSLEQSPADHGHTSPPIAAYTVEEFCKAHRLSRSMLYQLWTEGSGPRKIRIGAKVLISIEAAADWRRDREAANLSAEAKVA